MRRRVVAIVLVVLILGLGIGAAVLWNRPPADLQGEWLAMSYTRDGALPTLSVRVESGHLVGRATAGCNTSSGALTYRTGGHVTLDDWVTTTMACREPLDEVELEYFSALHGVDHVEVDGDKLVLSGDGVHEIFIRLGETEVRSGSGLDRVH